MSAGHASSRRHRLSRPLSVKMKRTLKITSTAVILILLGIGLYFYSIPYIGNITHYKELKFAKSTLMMVLENDEPTEQWVNTIGGTASKFPGKLFYILKVWFIEAGVTRDDIMSGYIDSPVFINQDSVSLLLNYKRNTPRIKCIIFTGKEDQKAAFTFNMNNCLFSADYNEDDLINVEDVILARKAHLTRKSSGRLGHAQ